MAGYKTTTLLTIRTQTGNRVTLNQQVRFNLVLLLCYLSTYVFNIQIIFLKGTANSSRMDNETGLAILSSVLHKLSYSNQILPLCQDRYGVSSRSKQPKVHPSAPIDFCSKPFICKDLRSTEKSKQSSRRPSP